MMESCFRRAGSLLLCVLLLSALLVPTAAAGGTVTVSGPISGRYTVDAGVSKVILNGVKAADMDAIVAIPNSCEVELASGTKNTCGVYCVGDLRLTGGGALVGGWGIVATQNLTLDLAPEGTVLLDAGNYIFTFHGDIIVNSGTYRIQADAPDAPYPILAMDGSIALSGGDLAVWSTDSCIVSMNGTITVGDAKLNLNSPKDLMIANAFEQKQSGGSALEIRTNTERRDQYVAPGSVQQTETGVTYSETPGAAVVANGVSDVGETVKLAPGIGGTAPDAGGAQAPDDASGETPDGTAQTQTQPSGSVPAAVWIALGTAAVAAAWLLYRRQHPNTKSKKGK